MRITPEIKVYLYLLTQADAQQVFTDRIWQERYHFDAPKWLVRLKRRRYLQALGTTGYALTPKGQAALKNIEEWLWIHEYYLPGVIDFAVAKKRQAHTALSGYSLLVSLIEAAKQRVGDDQDYLAILLRHQLKLEFGTQHDQAALATLMQLIDSELDTMPPDLTVSGSYQHSWAKVTAFEKERLTRLLGRLGLTVDDFEMMFADWLQNHPSRGRFFTNFEKMTIVMYELGHAHDRLDTLYQTAAARYRRHHQSGPSPSAPEAG
jgi:hypothetical protein